MKVISKPQQAEAFRVAGLPLCEWPDPMAVFSFKDTPDWIKNTVWIVTRGGGSVEHYYSDEQFFEKYTEVPPPIKVLASTCMPGGLTWVDDDAA